ncbi:hypothetical protein SAMN02746041_01707 [Desulfacinum hydrothermale DSM 13146]|uniref:Uncharacterized protein n=1 Tax=Desulfacinum hydrothermale DSM 13146 TaxID=1121390 RepID=A0A1W1XIL2_9BACT|nr:hypothetical protein [Desulfacinum hydrothermale]SMC23351.1 hypothetical protein SAMN02746041_01707 [Desulfacinum hydrothermale DSM 13146]
MEDESQRTHRVGRFQERAGFPLVYQPVCSAETTFRKHPCPDCHFCQQCSESRCRCCRSGQQRGPSAQFPVKK